MAINKHSRMCWGRAQTRRHEAEAQPAKGTKAYPFTICFQLYACQIFIQIIL